MTAALISEIQRVIFISSIVLLDSLEFLAILRNQESFCELKIYLKKMIAIHSPCFSKRNKKKVYLKGPPLVHLKGLLPRIFVL